MDGHTGVSHVNHSKYAGIHPKQTQCKQGANISNTSNSATENFKPVRVDRGKHDNYQCAKEKNNSSSNDHTFVNICANFTAYMTKNTVSVSVNNSKTSALCDTGASVSCLSKSFLQKAFPDQKPSMNPCRIQSIVGVGGTHHAVCGVVNIDICFGTLSVTYPFYVIEDLHHSLILGHDFMETHNVTLDIRGKQMIIQDNLKVCHLRTNTGYARTTKPTVIKAHSEVDIQVKLQKKKFRRRGPFRTIGKVIK